MGKWFWDVDFPTIVVSVSAISVLILQLLLCFKAKRMFIKLLPIVLLVASMIVFCICSASINGWDGLGYLFFGLLSFGLIVVCGLGWGIWAIAKNIHK